MTRRERDLFGAEVPDAFVTARERYGLWPVSVWDLDMTDPGVRQLKAMVGDVGEARADAFQRGTGKTRYHLSKSAYKSVYGASIFNPVVATVACNMWCPPTARTVFDPFAGGGTRAIVCAKRGLAYEGVELREEECRAVQARCHANGVPCTVMLEEHAHLPSLPPDERDPGAGWVTLYGGDARGFRLVRPADFLLTCPPYWTLETYSEQAEDLSSEETTYREYVEGIEHVVRASWANLAPGARSVWVVGLTRGRDGNLKPLHHEVARLHRAAGFFFAEEVVLAYRQTGALRRVGLFEKGQHHLVRQHEYLLVFIRGGSNATSK